LNDFTHIAPDRRTAVDMAATQDEPVYWYVFSHSLSGEYARYGADHPLINQFVFQLIRIGRVPRWYRGNKYHPTEDDLKVADYVLDYWTSFAANGHLDGVASPPWPPVTPERPVAQIIGVPVESRVNYRAQQLAYWDELMKERH
jgi:carboxylesterase type B